MKHKILQRINVVNQFIDLPAYSNDVLDSVDEITSWEEWNVFDKRMVYPDPSGEFSIVYVGETREAKLIVHNSEDIDIMYYERSGRDGEFTWRGEKNKSSLELIKGFINEKV